MNLNGTESSEIVKNVAAAAARQGATGATSDAEQNANKISYELNITRGKGIQMHKNVTKFFGFYGVNFLIITVIIMIHNYYNRNKF